MEFYEWDQTCSVGVESLDLQHQKILKIIGELSDNFDASIRCDIVQNIIVQMQKYADEHFRDEEQLIEQYQPELLEGQRKQHEYFTEKVAEYTSGSTGSVTVKDIYIFMGSWWLKHILIWDMKYKGLITEDVHSAAEV